MARFTRLTRADLTRYSRAELLPRVEAEQQYWARKARHGLSAADADARAEFYKILNVVIDITGLSADLRATSAALREEQAADSSYWSCPPGNAPTSQITRA